MDGKLRKLTIAYDAEGWRVEDGYLTILIQGVELKFDVRALDPISVDYDFRSELRIVLEVPYKS